MNRIVSHPSTQEYRDNYDRVFGKRDAPVQSGVTDDVFMSRLVGLLSSIQRARNVLIGRGGSKV